MIFKNMLTAAFCFLVLLSSHAAGAAAPSVTGKVSERAGVMRRGYLLRQGVPIQPSSEADVRALCLENAEGKCVPAIIEPEALDENGKVRWLRVEVPLSMPAWRSVKLTLCRDAKPAPIPLLRKEPLSGGWRFTTSRYSLEFRNPDLIKLTAGGHTLLDGRLDFHVFSDVHSIIGGGGATTILTPFRAAGFEIREETPGRAVVVFRGRVPKQKVYSYVKGDIDPLRGFDCEARFFLNALSGTLRFEWRLTNQSGWKSWIERYALLLPVPPSLRVTANEAGIQQNLGSWAVVEDGAARMVAIAPFVPDLGPGAGMRLENGSLLHGGIDMPIDGAVTGRIPQVHRWFHYGMSRTFSGALLIGGTADDARAELLPLHFQLPAQYYSDTGVLPERGDKLTNGEFDEPVARAANWLLENQWRGTLWWGEWWREFDLTRQQGAEEASNGNSAVAPLYHYYRTGDGRHLECARRAAFYTYDVQFNRARTGPGPFLHARRHLLDEQDWVHPRYQRLTGALIASHSLLAAIEREELMASLRSYTDKLMDEQGRMHDWDKRANQPGGPAGVDTSNIMEALVECWHESGDASFLEKARRMSRWTMSEWRARKPGTWNWNLSQYVLRGLVAVGRATRDQQVIRTSIDIARDVLTGQSEAELHFVFYNAWMASELNRAFGANLPLEKFLDLTRRNLDHMGPDGNFPVALPEAWAPYPSIRSSYYDSKAFVAYIPSLTARLAAMKEKKQP
jgi:hypothetical protein